MAKLQITTAQKTTVDNVDAHLQDAFAEGVEVASGPVPVLDPIQSFTTLTSPQQNLTKDTFRLMIAAVIKVFAGVSVTINYRKSDGVSNGTLTFTNGILTGST